MAYVYFVASTIFLIFSIVIIIPRLGNIVIDKIPYADIINIRKIKAPLLIISIGLFVITKEDATIAYYGFPDKETMKIANNINISTYKEYEIHLKNKKEEDKNKKEEDEKIKQNELKLKQELDIKRHNEEYERSKNKPKEEKFIPGDENNIIIIPGQSPMTLKECRNKGICPMAR